VGPGPILHDEELRNELKATVKPLTEIYIFSAHVRRVDEHCCVAIRRLDGGKGEFQPTGKERGRGGAGGWQMADSGIDTGESNVVKNMSQSSSYLSGSVESCAIRS
jgi:hypothetical protein